MIVAFFWVLAPRRLVGRRHVSIFKNKYGDSMFVRNVGIFLDLIESSDITNLSGDLHKSSERITTAFIRAVVRS